MKSLLGKTMMGLAVILLIAGFAFPHICLEGDSPTVKTEQSLTSGKMALADHDNGSTHKGAAKAKDGCCVSHHCCVAKFVTLGHVVFKTDFYSPAGLIAPSVVHFSSFDPQGLDRPPKFFA